MTVNSTRDFIPPEPFEGQNYKPRYARPSASLREEIIIIIIIIVIIKTTASINDMHLLPYGVSIWCLT